jgi:hypothetical protein
MISCYAEYLRLVVRVRPLVSVPVSGDRHSVSYSPLCTARRRGPTQPYDQKVCGSSPSNRDQVRGKFRMRTGRAPYPQHQGL